MIVPAVTEVSFPQAAHSQLARRRFSSQPLSWPQAGQTKPSGQRLAARCRAQEASSGKPASKAARDIGRGHGAVIFPAAGHHETLHEHAADAHQKLNISSNRAQRDTCLSMKVRSPMPCSCSCLSPTRSQRRRRELHGADSDMAQRLETAMAHTLRLGSLAELHG